MLVFGFLYSDTIFTISNGNELIRSKILLHNFYSYIILSKVNKDLSHVLFFGLESIIRSMMYLVPNFAADVVSDGHISSQSILELCSNASIPTVSSPQNYIPYFNNVLVEFQSILSVLVGLFKIYVR